MSIVNIYIGTKKIHSTETTLTSLFEIVASLDDKNVSIHSACGGNRTCGKCKIKLIGEQEEISAEEKVFLSENELLNNIRLACFASIKGNCDIYLDSTNNIKVSEDIILSSEQDVVYSADKKRGLGVAVDIGTTTVTASLYDMFSGKRLATSSEMNDQKRFGADVISRISFQIENGTELLRNIVCSQIVNLINSCLKKAEKPKNLINSCVITGNTTMLHFLCGLDAAGIAASPFTPKSLFGNYINSSEILPSLNLDIDVYLPICIGSYVGADITCGIVATGLDNLKENSILLDIGTNGEMVLLADNKMVCCSTAAGPAFEGAEIHCGMISSAGAISHVKLESDKITYEVIGDVPPIGICGSGILDACAVFFKMDIIEESGYINEDVAEKFNLLGEWDKKTAIKIGDSEIILTAEDVRKVQLAKAAIRAGVETLLQTTNTNKSTINRLIISGGFGNFLNPKSAAIIGLIPPTLVEQVEIAGNSAANGAAILLLNENLRDILKEKAKNILEVSLSNSAVFMENYIEQMFFGS